MGVQKMERLSVLEGQEPEDFPAIIDFCSVQTLVINTVSLKVLWGGKEYVGVGTNSKNILQALKAAFIQALGDKLGDEEIILKGDSNGERVVQIGEKTAVVRTFDLKVLANTILAALSC